MDASSKHVFYEIFRIKTLLKTLKLLVLFRSNSYKNIFNLYYFYWESVMCLDKNKKYLIL